MLSGSRDDQGAHGNARAFFAGLDIHTVEFDGALAAPEPMHPPMGFAPMHPSFEDRPGAVDRVFAALDDAAYERQVAAWSAALIDAGAQRADVLHLSHLTPLNEAAGRVAPEVPVVGHLHGTELLMLERIDAGPPAGWRHAARWAARMRDWAATCTRVVLLSDSQLQRAVVMLDVDPDRCVVVANGYDPERFHPQLGTGTPRREVWHHTLVDAPRGWRPGEGEGTIAYTETDLEGRFDAGVLLYVGRFTEVKRLGLLITAHARAQRETGVRAPLVIVGGHPGEWEGEHPLETVQRIGARDVFLAGWHDHDELPELLRAADTLVLPSVREQFGQVLVEAMACGLAPIAVDRFGPAEIVRDGESGWLVEPDDEAGLAHALGEAMLHPAERRRRGDAALRRARECYAWPAIAATMSQTLSDAIAVGPDRVQAPVAIGR